MTTQEERSLDIFKHAIRCSTVGAVAIDSDDAKNIVQIIADQEKDIEFWEKHYDKLDRKNKKLKEQSKTTKHKTIKEFVDIIVTKIVNKPSEFNAAQVTSDFLSGSAHRQNEIIDIIKKTGNCCVKMDAAIKKTDHFPDVTKMILEHTAHSVDVNKMASPWFDAADKELLDKVLEQRKKKYPNENDVELLVIMDDIDRTVISFFDGVGFFYEASNGRRLYTNKVTHWMPFPEPPMKGA